MGFGILAEFILGAINRPSEHLRIDNILQPVLKDDIDSRIGRVTIIQ